MKINIIIAYRPFSQGCTTSPDIEFRQLPDGRWNCTNDLNGLYAYGSACRPGGEEYEKDELTRTIKFLNKNSYFKHNIIVVVDHDVYPHENYLKEFDNVKIIKTKQYKPGDKIGGVFELPDLISSSLDKLPHSVFRCMIAMAEGMASIPDDEWLCYAYMSDLICGKDWDKYIVDIVQEYGNDFVYVPMFVEIRDTSHNIMLKGVDPTPDLIWEEWRKKICIHVLTMPEPSKGYFTEEDMEYYMKRANEADNTIYLERCGDRHYGIWALMTMKAKYAKKAFKLEGSFDIRFDDRLRDEFQLMKAVSAKSFIFHPISCPFKY